MPAIRAYHHVSLSVSDLGASTDFYREVLGLEVVAEIEGATFRRNRLRPPDGALTLTLTAHEDRSTEGFSERRPGLDHVAFRVDGAELASWKERFERLGIDHSGIKESSGGSAMITLRDPDGIQLEVFGGPTDDSIAAGRPGR